LRHGRDKQKVTLDDGNGDFADLAPVVLRVVSRHLERPLSVDRVAGRENALRLLDQSAAPERSLETLVLAEALQRDVDRAVELLWRAINDVGEDSALRVLPGGDRPDFLDVDLARMRARRAQAPQLASAWSFA
jgi:hypothetical protein